jgi:hypothetical protein
VVFIFKRGFIVKAAAFERAKKRLLMAANDFEALSQSKDFDEFEPRWCHFLISANAVDMILESHAKGPREQPFYGKRVKLRRTDPLLRYMHYARNSAEHGIEPVVQHQAGRVAIGRGGEPVHIKSLEFNRGKMVAEFVPINGVMPTVEVVAAHPKLVPVFDMRSKTRADPPTTHLGEPLNDTTPIAVGLAWLSYLQRSLLEMEQFVD